MPVNLTLQDSHELVMAAIHRIEEAGSRFREVNADPTAGPGAIAGAREDMETMEHEFGWQWKNVRAVLTAKERED